MEAEDAGTWQRGVSQEEKKAQRISLVHLWMRNRAECDAAMKGLEEEGRRLPLADLDGDTAS